MPLPDTIVVFALMPVPVRRAPTGSVAVVLNVSAVPEILAVTVLVGGTAVIANGCWLETTYDVLLPDWMTLPAPMPVPVRTSPAASVAGESKVSVVPTRLPVSNLAAGVTFIGTLVRGDAVGRGGNTV